MRKRPQYHDDVEALVDAILAKVGKRVVLALPLGLGKANHVANALYARAQADSSISLTILTALTLEKPRPRHELQRRFLTPIIDRLFGDYPELTYCEALRAGQLPANIEVSEFFLLAGRWLDLPRAQQGYISANYTHVARYLRDRGVNVSAQLVAKRFTSADEDRVSLSCNPDVTLELLDLRRRGDMEFAFVGEVNDELPFMVGDADLPASEFDFILEGPAYLFPLYAPPKLPVSTTDYAIGLHTARLVRDGGTLQIGIGSIGDAMAQALILRHRDNAAFRNLLGRLMSESEPPGLSSELSPFETGLYGASEMLVDSFLPLMEAGIVKRQVDGAVLQAAFFLGPKAFYRALREMPEAERRRISMTAVSYVNQLYGEEAKKRRARVHARFVNNAMMVTLLGAVVSDGLEDGQVVSGIGGQYNFVAQAFALEDARSIIALKATRRRKGQTTSNIRWSYSHESVPRHLRDIVVTEYGIADLRGKTDSAVVAALLAVADSRFQHRLLKKAKSAGKIAADYEIPPSQRENTPARVRSALSHARAERLLPDFPFGTDFTTTEQRLIPALERLKHAAHAKRRLGRLALAGLMTGRPSPQERECLERMGLSRPSNFKEHAYRALLRGAMRSP